MQPVLDIQISLVQLILKIRESHLYLGYPYHTRTAYWVLHNSSLLQHSDKLLLDRELPIMAIEQMLY